MYFSDHILIKIGVFLLGFCGFAVARHIRDHKMKNTPLTCPVGFDCHTVVHSDYSRLFGISVEFLGMIYYSFVFFVYGFLVFVPMPEIMSMYMLTFMTLISLIALFFSIYLIFVQIFILKKGCSWCIVSSFISALIFILTTFI